MPEVKIKTAQEKTIRRVWPISGWITRSKEIIDTKTIDNKYFKYKFELLTLQRILEITIIKKGFNNSIGWNLGKKNKSIHLFDPFTSIPIIGTKNKEIKVIKKRKYE